jgi:hypothetical protein
MLKKVLIMDKSAMGQSALEKEVIAALLNFRAWLKSHDRGVLIGFAMGCVPIFPVTLIGFFVCIFNQYLLIRGVLGFYEKRLIKMGLLISVFNLFFGIVIIVFLYHWIVVVGWSGIGLSFKDKAHQLLELMQIPAPNFSPLNQQSKGVI